jgi:hypothetical protein
MAPKSPLVDEVRGVARERVSGKSAMKGPPAEVITVRFAGGTVAKLDPENSRDRTWTEVLESLHELGAPAYVELDPETSYVTALLLPLRTTVTKIRDLPDGAGLELDFDASHARHFLRRGQPHFAELEKALVTAHRTKKPVLVTKSLDESVIIDVRPARRGRGTR